MFGNAAPDGQEETMRRFFKLMSEASWALFGAIQSALNLYAKKYPLYPR